MESGVEAFLPSESNPKKVGSVKVRRLSRSATIVPSERPYANRSITFLLAPQLKDGSTLSCDAVILGIGAQPNTNLLKEAGIEVEKDGGVNVNEHLKVKGRDNVFAIGDIAHYPFNGKQTRIESAVPLYVPPAASFRLLTCTFRIERNILEWIGGLTGIGTWRRIVSGRRRSEGICMGDGKAREDTG
jgi:NADPH-dependent glutamate synthase beta subunit-like oxidoreductase